MSTEPALVADPDDVTAAWFTDVLRYAGAIDRDCEVTDLEARSIGTGQVGANIRYELVYSAGAGPSSMSC